MKNVDTKRLELAFRLMKRLEFEPDEVYEAYKAYKKKNAVNRQRIEEEY